LAEAALEVLAALIRLFLLALPRVVLGQIQAALLLLPLVMAALEAKAVQIHNSGAGSALS
jgi:hypothetical protein